MKNIFTSIRLFAGEQLSRFKVKSAAHKLHEAEINRAVEQVVDQINPRLRALGSYRKRLFPLVEATVAYAEKLAAGVPGPLMVDRKSWGTDPLVNALFGSVERMRQVLSGPEVRKYVKAHPLEEGYFAVLVAIPDVRNQLGMELTGDTVQRDVRQTTVSFSNHEVAVLGADEADVRRQLAAVAHEILVGIAAQDILERESRIIELEDRLRIVRIKRRVIDVGSRGAAFIMDGSAAHLQEMETLKARIEKLEQELAEAKVGMEGLDDYLSRLVEQLGTPETHLVVEPVKVRMDRMNIVRDGGDDSTSTELSFHRVHRGGTPMRVLTLIHFPRSEMLEDAERLRGLSSYLD